MAQPIKTRHEAEGGYKSRPPHTAREMYRASETNKVLEESYTFTIPGLCTVTTIIDRDTSSARKDPPTSAKVNQPKDHKRRRWFPWWSIALLGIFLSKRIADLFYLVVVLAGILAVLFLIKDNLRLPNFRKLAVQVLDKVRAYLAD
ncbi:hypothetical protein PSACC_00454 [Paramicrosporidium saccamoebae]|uniref:Uncharacterized protein n=1 Tax=Paramicrosporidium saccamoebae TaxID=1246581 RepID=A0A2H9TPQ1_9FUNG|nr:hypothetical protein PSACC_00454 [Paramicrosporidium saccamoebae]